ncbi:MAG: hypothetical protein GX855_02655 [Firmicutes bacterium]|nr:hypothetical protein [Bacillota bacterium]
MNLRTLLVVIIAIGALYTMLGAVAELPPYGAQDNPSFNPVTERYIGKALEETGVLNMVTSIVLDYRAYDTMFESIVLLTAALAVTVVLKTDEGMGDRR